MPKKGKKGKKSEDQKQPKAKAPKQPKFTPAATKERRAKKHENRLARKERHLMKRCAELERKLSTHTSKPDGMTWGRYHKNLNRMVRLREGTLKRKPRKQEQVQEQDADTGGNEAVAEG